jgi:hypothetical protein
MDANGTHAHKLVESGDDNSVFAQAWSADSQRLIYSRERGPTLLNVLSRDLKSATTVEVETDFWKNGDTENVLLLPDGRNLFGRVEPRSVLHSCNFWLARNDLRTGKVIEAATTNQLDWILHEPYQRHSRWQEDGVRSKLRSPDGVCCRSTSGGKHLSNLRHLTQTETWTWPDEWTPDSKWLIFHSAGGDRQVIYRQSLNGDSPELLVPDSTPLGPATVSPDGSGHCTFGVTLHHQSWLN